MLIAAFLMSLVPAVISTKLYAVFIKIKLPASHYISITLLFSLIINLMCLAAIWIRDHSIVYLIQNYREAMVNVIFVTKYALLSLALSCVLPCALKLKAIRKFYIENIINRANPRLRAVLLTVCGITLLVSLITADVLEYRRIDRQLATFDRQMATYMDQLVAANENVEFLLLYMISNERPDWEYLSDLEKARHIRDWLLLRLPIGSSDINDLPWKHVLIENLKHNRGVLCGGSAYLFAHILNLFNLEAVYTAYGIYDAADGTPNATHAWVAVRIEHEGVPMIVLLDSFTGLEFFKRNGEGGNTSSPADLKELTYAIKYGNVQDFYYDVTFHSGQAVRVDDDPYKVTLIDLETWQISVLLALEDFIEKHGYEASVFSYLLLPFYIGFQNINLRNEILDFYKEIGLDINITH
jgi:hypothetical protein